MPSLELENLVRIGKLKPEPGAQKELDGLIHSGKTRLGAGENLYEAVVALGPIRG